MWHWNGDVAVAVLRTSQLGRHHDAPPQPPDPTHGRSPVAPTPGVNPAAGAICRSSRASANGEQPEGEKGR